MYTNHEYGYEYQYIFITDNGIQAGGGVVYCAFGIPFDCGAFGRYRYCVCVLSFVCIFSGLDATEI